VYKKLFVWRQRKFVKNRIGGACSMYRGKERCMQGFGGKTGDKETTWKTQEYWEDNIKMNSQEV
jgi:hypothetical protein